MVVELDPVADHPYRVLLGFEAVPVDTLLLQGADHTLDHAVLLRAERLAQAVAADQSGVVSTGKYKAVVRTQQERLPYPAQRAERLIRVCSRAADAVESLPLRESCQPKSTRLWQSYAQGEGQPAIPAAPDPAQVGRPALIRGHPAKAAPGYEVGHRWPAC